MAERREAMTGPMPGIVARRRALVREAKLVGVITKRV
jgi:hypothetical protein